MPKHNNKAKQEKQKSDADAAKLADEGRKEARLQTLRGMRDILPDDMRYWDAVARAVADTARAYRYERLMAPLLEATSLFTRGVGEATDIVEKEMYTFQDKSQESVSLRPEFTASFARAYIEHGFASRPQPVRLYDFGPAFRYDRPQAGRYRQLWQADFEVMGDSHPVVDAQLVGAAAALYRALGLPVLIHINSIGDASCRPHYMRALTEHAQRHAERLCEDCRRRLEKNPLRVLDCKQESCQAVLADAPQIVDWLCEGCRDHFVKVLEYLDELEISYQLEPRLVRGFDYYTRTTFEVFLNADAPVPASGEAGGGSGLALGGGGRYDGLIELLGGRPTPAVGFAAGIERIILAMQRVGSVPATPPPPQIFLAQLGNDARTLSLKLFSSLQAAGFMAAEQFSKNGLSAQLEVAAKVGCRYTLILGQKELMDGTIIVRDMESGIQEIIEFTKVVQELEKRLTRVETRAPRGGGAAPAAATAEGGPLPRVDLKREEYLLKDTAGEADENAAAETEVEIEETVVEVGVSEEVWDKEEEAPEKSGLSWVSKDYAEDQFDE